MISSSLPRTCWLAVALGVAACAETRRDPCALLSVGEVSLIDAGVTFSMGAAREGERLDNEVRVFHSENGDARVMQFLWYDANREPGEVVAARTGENRP